MEEAANSVNALATVTHFNGGSTLLVGGPNYAGSCTLAAACLISSDGLSAYEAILRVREACPAGPLDMLRLAKYEAEHAACVNPHRASWLLNL